MIKETEKTRSILLLEDEIKNSSINIEQLERTFSLHVYVADTYEKAKSLLEQQTFSLFILDIQIIGERYNGIQFAAELRQIPQYIRTPIIFISMHTHFSGWILTQIKGSTFIPKPFKAEDLLSQVGLALDIPAYVRQHYDSFCLLIHGSNGLVFRFNALNISYLEVNGHLMYIQFVNGELQTLTTATGEFKQILMQVRNNHISCLRQTYRSIIINVNQISRIEINRNRGDVFLFNDDNPKPLGIRYRKNLTEFLKTTE